jgi:phage gp29-like protein
MGLLDRASALFRAPKAGSLSVARHKEEWTHQFVNQIFPSDDHILNEKGGGDISLYKKLLSDDLAASNFQQRRLAVVARDWSVEPGAHDKASGMAADFMRELIDRIGWDDVCDKMLYAVWYGYGVGEGIYASDGNQITLERIDVPDRSWFGFDRDLRLCIRPAFGYAAVDPVPDRKFWTVNYGGDNDFNPYGRGLAHWLYWPIFFKRMNLPQWLKFLEASASPTALGKVPAAWLEDDSPNGQKAKVMAMLTAMSGSSAVAIPNAMEAEIIHAMRAGDPGYAIMLDKMDKAIMRTILSQTMTTEDGSSRSQAEVHKDVRDEVVRSDSDRLHETFNRTLGVWLTEMNFSGATPPRVYRIMEDPEDLTEIARRDTALKGLGWRRTDESFNETYGEGQYEQAEEGREEEDEDPPEFAAPDNPDEVDRFVAMMMEESDPLIREMVAPLVESLEGVTDPAIARAKVLAALEDMPVNPLTEMMAKAGIYARGEAEGRSDDALD